MAGIIPLAVNFSEVRGQREARSACARWKPARRPGEGAEARRSAPAPGGAEAEARSGQARREPGLVLLASFCQKCLESRLNFYCAPQRRAAVRSSAASGCVSCCSEVVFLPGVCVGYTRLYGWIRQSLPVLGLPAAAGIQVGGNPETWHSASTAVTHLPAFCVGSALPAAHTCTNEFIVGSSTLGNPRFDFTLAVNLLF